MSKKFETIYVYEKRFPNGEKRLIEMTESQIVRHMHTHLRYPPHSDKKDLLSDFMAIYYAIEKKRTNRNWRN